MVRPSGFAGGSVIYLQFNELILAYSTDGAYPVIRDILEFGAGSNAMVRIAESLIINVRANGAFPFHE